MEPRDTWEKARLITYWFFTLLVSFEMMAGGVWDLLRIEYVRVILTHLGYPHYLLNILGIWKIPCALALIAPRFLRLKEWAYAGAVFTYTGAAASHIACGDPAGKWVVPVMLCVFALASWFLRPPDRRLPSVTAPESMRAMSWFIPAIIALLLLALSFITIPQGPQPM